MSNRSAIENIYSRFKYQKKYQLTEILKTTKDVIVNSSKYKDYSKDYYHTTHINTFKKPEIEAYPIIKNKELIPLNNTIFRASTERKKKKEKKKLLLNNLLITNPGIVQKKNKETPEKQDLFERRCHTSRARSKMEEEQNKIFLLRDILFFERKYNALIYDDSIIFHNKNYETFIRDYIKKMQTEKPSFKETSLVKVYHNFDHNLGNDETLNNNRETKMILSSISIEFENLTDQHKKNLKLSVPLVYLPLFYYQKFSNMKYLLLACIKFLSDFESVDFDEDEMYNLITTSVEFYIDDEDASIQNNATLMRTESNKHQKEANIFEQEETFFDDEDEKRFHPKTKIYINGKNAVECKNNWNYYNNFSYYWITPKYLYKIKIKVPEVTVQLHKKIIKKYIDVEFILFLIKNKFKNWDFFLIHYLFSLKTFRWIIENILSKCPKKLNYLENIKNDYHFSFSKVQDVEYIFLSHQRINQMTLKNYYFKFFYTEKNQKNFLNNLHSFSLSIYNDNINPNNDYIFDLNFEQMKILNQIGKTENLKDFINKIIISNKELMTIDLNFSFSEHFNHKDYSIATIPQKKEQKFQNDRLIILNQCHTTTNTNTYTTNDFGTFNTLGTNILGNQQNDFVITISYPHLETIKYLSKVEISQGIHGNCIISDTNEFLHRNLKQEVLDNICSIPITEWANALYKTKFLQEGVISYSCGKKKTNKAKKSGILNKISPQKRGTFEKTMLL